MNLTCLAQRIAATRMSAMQESWDNSDDLREEERLEESLEYLKELDLKV